jgi:hypothetical protein
MKRVDEMVLEKKKKAIEAKAKQINRFKMRQISAAVKRSNRIKSLLEIWKQGGLNNATILEKMGEDFGLTQITDEQNEYIDQLLDEIDNAPQGFEQERLEEKLQAYLEWHGHPNFLGRAFLERMKARMLSGPITALKNALGSVEAVMMVGFKLAINKGDKQMRKVVWQAHTKAFASMADILLRGGVDTGLAQSERTGTKEGSPRVRYMENPRADFREKNNLWQKFVKGVNKLDRIPQRLLSAVDAFNHIMLQETEAYNIIKDDIKKRHPYMSDKDAAKMAYEVTYAVPIAEARAQAMAEYTERGITPSNSRFNRRVHEIIQQARSEEVEKKSLYFANRYTYKAADIGVASGAGQLVALVRDVPNKAIGRLRKDVSTPAAERALDFAEFTSNLIFDQLIPFIKTVGNILEKGMELNPMYGGVKAAAYTGVAGFNKANKSGSSYDFERAAEYYWRAAAGLAFVALMYAMIDDDDEDGEKAIYGEGPKDWREQSNRARQRPVNTVKIKGHAIPMDLFGPFAVTLRIEGAKQDALRYKDGGRSIVSNLINDLYFEKTARLIKDFQRDGQIVKSIKRELAESTTRAVVPLTGFSRQTMQMLKPQAQKPATMPELLMKYSGLVAGWNLNKPAVDYRGRAYDMGGVYTSSADGFVKMFKKMENIDKVDEFVFKYAPAMTQKSQADDEIVVWENGDFRPFTDEEFYEYKKAASEKFDKLLKPYAETGESIKLNKKQKSITDNQLEDGIKLAMKEYAAQGKEATKDEIEERAKEIVLETKLFNKIKDGITERKKLASDAALEEFYIKHGLRVPIDIEGSIDAYNAEQSK